MRTTTNSLFRSMHYNIAKGQTELNKLYLQSSTGKKVSVASDNPAAVGTINSSRSSITMQDRYIENIETAQDGMNIVDSYLGTVEDVMQRAKEIATASINGSVSESDLATYADEVSSLKEQLLNIANTQVNGKYLFAGFADDSAPFGSSPVVYNGTSDVKYVESGPGETIATNIPGDTIFTTPIDVFAELDNLETFLRTEDTGALESSLDTIEVATDQIRTQRSLMGNNNARLDDSKAMLEDAKVQTQSTLSRYEDADLTEVISEMTQAEQALEAALMVSSRITNLSLLNYL